MSELETKDGFAAMLKDLFAYAKVTNKDVARMMDVSERTVRNWLEGYSEPDPSSLAKLFRLLNVPAIPFLRGRPQDASDREAVLDYVRNVASDDELHDMAFNIFVPHGSSLASQVSLVSMLNHMTLRYRLMIAKMVLNLWEIAESEGGLQYTDTAMPDVDKVRSAIIKSHRALEEGRQSYTDI